MRSTPDGPISKVIGIGFLLLLPAGLGVLSIPIYLGATLLFVSWVMSRTKARPRTPFQTTRPTALSTRTPVTSLPTPTAPNPPADGSPTEGGRKLNFAEAYERTVEELRQLLLNVADDESAQSFVEEAVRKLEAAAAATPEFCVGRVLRPVSEDGEG